MDTSAQPDINSVLGALQTLAGQQATAVPVPTIPTLGYTAPSVGDLSSQYQEFLNRAAQDPDIVNYYNQLLQKAGNDTTIAQNYLEQDYQTGVRNTISNLQGTLKQLNLQSTVENKQLQDQLNQRGIALTQDPSGKLTYAGGGESQTELGQLQQNQSLRQEAEQRSAKQGITGLAQTLQKGITSSGQQLASTALNLQQQKSADIASRAGTYMDLSTQKQLADQQAAANKQAQATTFGITGQLGKPGSMTADQKQQLWQSQGNQGQAPVGWWG